MANLTEPVGEAWMTGNESVFASGPFAGHKLSEAWPRMPKEWTGTDVRRGRVFPILAKFIFADEKLSVQVHPDDDYAAQHEAAAGGLGKTEMWYVLQARPGAEVLAGLKPSVTAESFRQAIADGTAEDCLEHVPMKTGEAIFIPARTAHTIGPGLVLCEVQQHSDLTYRVYDYDRRDAQGRTRELHVEKALAVMRFGAQTCGKMTPLRLEHGGGAESYFVACRYFATEKWDFSTPLLRSTSPAHFDLLLTLEGRGAIAWGGERAEYGPAQAWLLPAALENYRLEPSSPSSLLRTYVPGSLDHFGEEFSGRGISASEWGKLVRR